MEQIFIMALIGQKYMAEMAWIASSIGQTIIIWLGPMFMAIIIDLQMAGPLLQL